MIGNRIRVQNATSSSLFIPSQKSSALPPAILSLYIWPVLLLVVMMLAACGPASDSSSSDQVLEETKRIALELKADSNVDKARAAVDGLDMANPRQWLVMITEQSIADQNDPAVTAALVELTEALGLESSPIHSYANQIGLVEPAPVEVPTVVANVPSLMSASEDSAAQAPDEPSLVATDAGAASKDQNGEAGEIAAAEIDQPPGEEAASPTAEVSLPAPTATPPGKPIGRSTGLINVRNGPGTEYAAVAAVNEAEAVDIVGKNPAGDWWEIQFSNGQVGWVLGQLVAVEGDVSTIAVADDIPEPPTPAPEVVAAPVEEPAAAPQEEAPAEEVVPPPDAGPDFRLVEKRLWDVFENGGSLDGPTVTCGAKRELHVVTLDANGGRMNGVAVQALLGAKEIIVTGAQGKGDGQAEFVLGGGQDLKIVRDTDGREVTSDVAYGLTTDPRGISFDDLIAAKYCTDAAECDGWVNDSRQPPPCLGHYSWTVTFQRKY